MSQINLETYVPGNKKQKIDGSDLESILSGGVSSVGFINPVKDFEAILARRDIDLVDQAIEQMKARILQLVNDSIRDQLFKKALDCLVSLRKGCVREDEPDAFNDFLKQIRSMFELKKKKDFWLLIKTQVITLISEDECEESSTSKEEAEQFLTEVKEKEVVIDEEKTNDEMDELFDMAE